MPLWRRRRGTPRPEALAAVAGVVPCAGTSSRMGESKALLDAGGRSFLAATVGSLIAGGCDPVLVVVAPGRPHEERKAMEVGAKPIVNPDPGEGPITSIRTALAALEGAVEAIALLPVDHPLIDAETVNLLRTAFLDSSAPLALPMHGSRRGHPALLRRSLFAELLDPGLQGGARTVVHAHLGDALLVPVEDRGVVTDIDTPEEYRAAFPARRRS